MCTLTRGERFKDARTVHNQHGSQSMDDVYKATGVSASMIKDLEDDEKERSVGYDKIATLAKYYGVSADYLLGLSQYTTVDKDLEFVCKYTGLNERSVKYLKYLVDIHSGKVVPREAIEELEKGQEDDEYYAGYYEYLLLEYEEDDYRQKKEAKEYGIANEDDKDAIAKAHIADAKRIQNEKNAANYEEKKEECARNAVIPSIVIDAILSCESQKGILEDLFYFLQLDPSKRWNGSQKFELSIGNKSSDNETDWGGIVHLPTDTIAWAFLKKAENSLSELRGSLASTMYIDTFFP